MISDDAIDYIVVDRRLSHELPTDGYYYERDEPRAGERTNAIAGASLRKFNSIPADSTASTTTGAIAIYDTAGLRSR